MGYVFADMNAANVMVEFTVETLGRHNFEVPEPHTEEGKLSFGFKRGLFAQGEYWNLLVPKRLVLIDLGSILPIGLRKLFFNSCY